MNDQLPELNDKELKELISGKGKSREPAFREIYKRYSKKIYFYYRKILGVDAEAQDIAQDTFLNYLKYLDSENILQKRHHFFSGRRVIFA